MRWGECGAVRPEGRDRACARRVRGGGARAPARWPAGGSASRTWGTPCGPSRTRSASPRTPTGPAGRARGALARQQGPRARVPRIFSGSRAGAAHPRALLAPGGPPLRLREPLCGGDWIRSPPVRLGARWEVAGKPGKPALRPQNATSRQPPHPAPSAAAAGRLPTPSPPHAPARYSRTARLSQATIAPSWRSAGTFPVGEPAARAVARVSGW